MDCAISASFITSMRTIGYCYKNAASKHAPRGSIVSLAEKNCEANMPLDKVPVALEADVSLKPKAITKVCAKNSLPLSHLIRTFQTARKRTHASFSDASLMDDVSNDATAQATSPPRPIVNRIHDTDTEDARREYNTYRELQGQLLDVNSDLTLINGKMKDTEARRVARLTALTDKVDTTLRIKYYGEDLTLQNVHRAAREALEKQQVKERQILYGNHKKEIELAKQEHVDAKLVFQKEEWAIIEERNAKLKEKNELEAASERRRMVLFAMPSWYTVFNEQLTERIKAERMELEKERFGSKAGEE
jgi:hypothetical protein